MTFNTHTHTHTHTHPFIPSDSTVWLYVFRLQACLYHSGIGTRGAYWAYAATGQYTNRNYAQDRCNGPLAYWYRLGKTNKTKEEIEAIVSGECMYVCMCVEYVCICMGFFFFLRYKPLAPMEAKMDCFLPVIWHRFIFFYSVYVLKLAFKYYHYCLLLL